MAQANVLTRLKIREVSSVNRGAGEGVKVVFSKSFGDTFEIENAVAKVIAMRGAGDGSVDDIRKAVPGDDQATLNKRVEVAGRLSQVADYRRSLTNGVLKIATAADVANAVHLVKSVEDPAAARAYVIHRAKALGCEAILPEGWNIPRGWIAKTVDALKGLIKAVDFDQAQESIEAGEYASGMMDEIMEGVCALQQSVASIMCDDAIVDKQPDLDKTFQQFKDHMQGVVPEWMEKSLTAAAIAAAMAKGVPAMSLTPEQITKLQDDLKKATDGLATATTQIATLKAELDVAKMSPEAQAYAKSMKLEGEALATFVKMDPKDRDEEMKKKPVDKAVIDALPESVRKALAAGEQALATLQKAAEEKDEKDAEEKKKALVLPDTVVVKDLAKSLRDPAMTAILKHVETLNEQITKGALFANFGSRPTVAGSAMALLQAKADDLMKTDKSLTKEKAFAKVYEDRANADLVKLQKSEEARAA